MRFIIILGAVSLIILIIGFQSKRFTADEDLQWYIYDVADSASWVIFSFMTYLITTGLRDVKRKKDIKHLRSFLGCFAALSICPLVNAINKESSAVLIGNYIYGGLVVTIYLTIWIVKKYKDAKPKA